MLFRASCLVAALFLQMCNAYLSSNSHFLHEKLVRRFSHEQALRLRGGGFFGESQAQNAAKQAQVAAQQPQEQSTPQPQPQAQQPPPQSLAQHAYEYALAGSMDGIRSGMGQSVGGEVREVATKLLQRGFWVGGMAFAQFFARLPFLGNKRAQCPPNGPHGAPGDQIAAGQAQPAGTGVCVCFVTAPTHAVAEALTKRLLESGSAACVNAIESVKSSYIWEGKLQRDSETLLLIKTQQALVPAVQELVKETHPYQVPEVIALGVDQGLPEYLQWVLSSTGRPSLQPVQPPHEQPASGTTAAAPAAGSARAAVEAAVAAQSSS